MDISIDLIKQYFPILRESALLEDILKQGSFRKISEGDHFIKIGQYIKMVPLVISGVIKISREDEKGNEVFLYYLEGGSTCAMSLTCCMGEGKSNVQAVAEEDTQVINIPVQFMDEWMGKYGSWRKFVIESYSTRFQELLNAIDSITFKAMDQRIEEYLFERAQAMKTNILQITHQKIAYDLNSSREAVSRILKKMEANGTIQLGRNKIELPML